MTLDLDALKLIAQAATPGPWKSDVWIETDGYGWRATGPHHEDNIDPMGSEPGCPEERAAQRDAAHIAAFSPDVVIALIAEIQRLRRFDDPQWLATLVAERDAALSRAESAERERDGCKRIVDRNERHPLAPERCPDCKWCNTHLMNYGTPQHWGDGPRDDRPADDAPLGLAPSVLLSPPALDSVDDRDLLRVRPLRDLAE